MVRRTHWYLLLLLGTVLGIVSCSSQGTTESANMSQNIPPEAITKRPEVTVTLHEPATGATMQTITVTNNATKTVEQFTEIPLIPAGYEGAVQYANGSLFVLQTSGENIGDMTRMGWMEALWRYPVTGSGERLLEGQGLYTRVSTNGRFVASTSSEGVKILRGAAKPLTKPLATVLGEERYLKHLHRVTLTPAAVNSLSSWFYFTGDRPEPSELIRIDNTSGALERFSLESVQIHPWNDVEPVSGRIVYWDRALASDLEAAKEQEKMPSVLRVYDPSTQKNKILMELPAGKGVEHIYWEDATTVLFKDGSETRRVTVE